MPNILPGDGTIPPNLSNGRIFYINIPMIVIVAIGIWFFLTLRTDSTSIREKLKRVDYLGIFIFVGSATSFLFGLTSGGVLFPWTSANVIVPLVLGVLGMVLFWYVEDYVVKEPMMPMRIFKERTAFAGYINTWVHGLILWSVIYYLLLWVTLLYVNNANSGSICSHPLYFPSWYRCTPHYIDDCSHGRHCRCHHDPYSPFPSCRLARLDHSHHCLRSLYSPLSHYHHR